MGKGKENRPKLDVPSNESQQGAQQATSALVTAYAQDEDIEKLTLKEREAYVNLIRERNLLEKERQKLQDMTDRRFAERALLNESAGNMDRIFSMTAAGDYVYDGKRSCCLDTGFELQCAAASTEDLPCKHELCSRAKTRGVSWSEYDTIKYYELRIYHEKSARMKAALRKQREVELARVKKAEDDDKVERVRKAALMDKKEKRDNIQALKDKQEVDPSTAMVAARTAMMQSFKHNAIVREAHEVSYDLSVIREEVEGLQRHWQDSAMDSTLPDRLQRAQDKLKETECRSNWLNSAMADLGSTTPFINDQPTLTGGNEAKSPDSENVAMKVLMDELEFRPNTSLAQIQNTVKTSTNVFSGNSIVPKPLLNAMKTLETEVNQFRSEDAKLKTKSDSISKNSCSTAPSGRLQVPAQTMQQVVYNEIATTSAYYQGGLQVEDSARQEIQREWDRLHNAPPEILLASLNKIKAAAIIKAPVPFLTDLVLDVVVSTALDVHKARLMLRNIDKLSDNDIVGQVTSAILARAEKNPLCYKDAMTTIETSFEATTFPIPERVRSALQRVRLAMESRLDKIMQKEDCPARKVAFKASTDIKRQLQVKENAIFTKSANSQIIAMEEKILSFSGGYEDMVTYVLLLFCCGYSPACGVARITVLQAHLTNKDASRADSELQKLARVVTDCAKPLPPRFDTLKATLIPWQIAFKDVVEGMFDVYKTLKFYLEPLRPQIELQRTVSRTTAGIITALALSVLEQIEANLTAILKSLEQQYGSKSDELKALVLRLVKMANTPNHLCNAGCSNIHRGEQATANPGRTREIVTESYVIDQAPISIEKPQLDSSQGPVQTSYGLKEEVNLKLNLKVDDKPVKLTTKISTGPARRQLLPRGQRKQSSADTGLTMMALSNMGKSTATMTLDFGTLQMLAYDDAGMQMPTEIKNATEYARYLLRPSSPNRSTVSVDKEPDSSEAEEDSDAEAEDSCRCPTCGFDKLQSDISVRASMFAEVFSEDTGKLRKPQSTKTELARHTKERLQGIVDGKASFEYYCWVAYKLRVQSGETPQNRLLSFRNFENLIYRVGPIPHTLSVVLQYASRGLSGLQHEGAPDYCERDLATVSAVHNILKKIQSKEISFNEDDESWRASNSESSTSLTFAEFKISEELEFSDGFFGNDIVLYNFLERIRADYRKNLNSRTEGLDTLVCNIRGLAMKGRFDVCRICLSDLIKLINRMKPCRFDDAGEKEDLNAYANEVIRGSLGIPSLPPKSPYSVESRTTAAVDGFNCGMQLVDRYLEAALSGLDTKGVGEHEKITTMVGLMKGLGLERKPKEAKELLKRFGEQVPEMARALVDVKLVPKPLNVNHNISDYDDGPELVGKNLSHRNDFLDVFEKFMASAQAVSDFAEQTPEECAFVGTFHAVAEKLEFVLGNVLDITAKLAHERGWQDIADDIFEALAESESEKKQMQTSLMADRVE